MVCLNVPYEIQTSLDRISWQTCILLSCPWYKIPITTSKNQNFFINEQTFHLTYIIGRNLIHDSTLYILLWHILFPTDSVKFVNFQIFRFITSIYFENKNYTKKFYDWNCQSIHCQTRFPDYGALKTLYKVTGAIWKLFMKFFQVDTIYILYTLYLQMTE